MTAIAQLEELYMEKGKRAGQLHHSGKKVIGYFCCFVPDEIIVAESEKGIESARQNISA